MPISEHAKNLFDLQFYLGGVDALVNPCNTHGAAGRGLSREFQKRYSTNYKEYAAACRNGKLDIGTNLVVALKEKFTIMTPKFVVNLATKMDWRNDSRPIYIERGVKDLVNNIKQFDIQSIIVPQIGCGLGGLSWVHIVKPIVYAYLDLKGVDVHLAITRDLFDASADKR
jgi:O-acetyl-ADP-ribose deacetylase (regulator of RNase III)